MPQSNFKYFWILSFSNWHVCCFFISVGLIPYGSTKVSKLARLQLINISERGESQNHPVQKCTRQARVLSDLEVILGDCLPYTEVHPLGSFDEGL